MCSAILIFFYILHCQYQSGGIICANTASITRVLQIMKLTPALSIRALAAVAALGLASCSLPPEAAWHVVKTDGLFPLISMEMGERPYPPGLAAYTHREGCSNRYMGSAYDREKPATNPQPLVVVHMTEEQPKPFPKRPDANQEAAPPMLPKCSVRPGPI